MSYKGWVRNALASLTLCTCAVAGAVAQTPPLKVAFPAVSETLSLPFLVARQQGWTDATPVQVNGDANALRALLSGTVDVAVVGDFSAFSAIGENARIKAIGSWQGVNDYQMVVDASIGSLKDLQGKTFASTGPAAPPEEFSKLVFRKHGIDPAQIQYVAIGSVSHASLLQAVLAGRAQGTLITTSTALTGVKSGKVKILQSVAQDFPRLGYVYNVVRTDELADPGKLAALQAFVTAGIKASRYIAAHPDDAARLAQAKFPASDAQVLQKTIHLLTDQKVWGINGGIEPDSITETLDIARSTGLLHNTVQAGAVCDYRFVDAALKTLGKQ